MIKFEHVGLRYGIGPEVLSDINLTLEPGAFRFLSGASGAGKTSLMSLLYLGRKPTRGLMTIFGKNVGQQSRKQLSLMRQNIGVVFQDYRLLNHMSAFDNVALPLRIQGQSEVEIKKNVEELLDWVDLGEYKNALPSTLSGGQQQRISIARAVITRPRLLLADEPTGNLDDNIGFRLMTLFDQLHKMGTTVIIASHNVALMDKFDHDRLILDKGKLSVHQPTSWIAEKMSGIFH
ncbi:MAG: cell division ATP-binding protein FtsE [Alphaproteobacteria bacterium]|nr:cell division ATP-binding protein FtsE [Alphaproteobacteria bacterium]NCQ87836.1 cell division ATP-binding protein FtsE [Alphaproteobacteria bacterium]NCT05656.1 cell division ATP-binding protein FtsE [Alphaproteobacteria bacterium]